MMCYRDRTFCPYWSKCREGVKCGRALTSVVVRLAERSKLPICQFAEEPDCFKKKGPDDISQGSVH
jgi:hypothetical protein